MVVVLAAVMAAGCGGAVIASTDSGTDLPLVVVSTSIWGDVVANVAGDAVHLEVLEPPGVDPHDFSLSSQQAALIGTADLVVVNGLGLEETMADAIDAARSDGVTVLELAPQLDPLPFGAHDHVDSGAGDDPHVWHDPTRVAKAVDLIRAAVRSITADPTGVDQRATAYVQEIESADRANQESLASIPEDRRKLVTNHDAFEYFADRYRFRIAATVIPGGSTLAEPSAAELKALVELIKTERIPAIFAETTSPSTLADAVAAELGGSVAVVTLASDTLGRPGTAEGTYLGLIRSNATKIADALS
jgi:zinc/manganese transport system substrate-binding protein